MNISICWRASFAGTTRTVVTLSFLGIDRRRKPIRKEVWNGQARREITTIARRLRADLVAVGTAGRTGVPYILLGSVAEHVMREAPCDVLVAIRNLALRTAVEIAR